MVSSHDLRSLRNTLALYSWFKHRCSRVDTYNITYDC